MATIDYQFRVKLPSINPNVDDATNSWYWEGDSATSISSILTDLKAFYTAVHGGEILGHFISQVIDRAALHCTIEVYDLTGHLDGSPHGGPITADTFTLGAHLGGEMPSQLAVVVDYKAPYGSDTEFGPHTRPRSRDRGRHYWGPLTDDAITAASSSPFGSTVSTSASGFFAAAYSALNASTNFGSGWSVWSRVNASMKQVFDGWVDTTVHVQRRRQDPSGIKVVWT